MAQIRDISKRTALYERLSKDDEQQGESNSILNQKQYLEEYAHRNGFVNIQHFTDDGYTGRNFNRPGFQEMLAEIDNGKIGTVIVKDMSRFGRNYLQVGFYTEIMFPQKQVRFIAINNSVDSDKPQDNDFTPFLNIMNEWYANASTFSFSHKTPYFPAPLCSMISFGPPLTQSVATQGSPHAIASTSTLPKASCLEDNTYKSALFIKENTCVVYPKRSISFSNLRDLIFSCKKARCSPSPKMISLTFSSLRTSATASIRFSNAFSGTNLPTVKSSLYPSSFALTKG